MGRKDYLTVTNLSETFRVRYVQVNVEYSINKYGTLKNGTVSAEELSDIFKYLQNLQRLHAKYTQSAKTVELNLRNTSRKMLDKNTILALSPKPNTFVCRLENDNNKESIRR